MMNYRKDDFTIILPSIKSRHNLYKNLIERGLLTIGPKSPLQYRKAAERIGRYFHRETGFDNIPYEARESTYPEHRERIALDRVYLLVEPDLVRPGHLIVIGGVGIRKRGNWWFLSWCWIHQYLRGEKRFFKVWRILNTQYPKLLVDGPHSPSMHRFLIKDNYYKRTKRWAVEVERKEYRSKSEPSNSRRA